MLRVQTGVDHEALGAEKFGGQLAKLAGDVAFIPIVLGGDLFGVERPALGVGGTATVDALAPVARQALGLSLQRDLEMVPRHALMVDEGAHGDDAEWRTGQRRPENAGPRTVLGRAGVVRRRRLLRDRRLALHHHGCLGREVEDQLRPHLGVAQDGLVAREQCRAWVFFLRLRVGLKFVHPDLDRAVLVAELLEQTFHLPLDAGDLAPAELMDFFRRHVRGRETVQGVLVGLVAPRQPPKSGVGGRVRQLLLQHRLRALVGGDDFLGRDFLGGGHERRALLGGHVLEFGRALIERGHEDVFRRLVAQEAFELPEHGLGDEIRHQKPARGRVLRQRDPVVHLRGDEVEAHEVILHVAPVANRVTLAEEIDEVDVESAELVENKTVVRERLRGHRARQRPLDDGGRDTMLRVELGAVEFRQLRETLLGARDTLGAVFARVRRELAVERVLLGAAEKLRERGRRGARADLVGRRGVGPLVEVRFSGARARQV